MKILAQLTIILTSVTIYGQEYVDVNYTKTDFGYQVYVTNTELCAVSVKVNFTLENMASSAGDQEIFVIPPQADRHEIAQLSIKDRTKASSFNISSLVALGDHFQIEYDEDYPYELPYDSYDTQLVMQGYDGLLSHRHQHALDFDIPEGGNIRASRGGVVIQVEDRNSRSCPSPSCSKYNNYIRIYHSDGTFAEYTHIQKRSTEVKVGDIVEAGQVIAKCGKVGWATGPHLHFEVYLLRMDKKITVPTRFKLSDDHPLVSLQEKMRYRKNY